MGKGLIRFSLTCFLFFQSIFVGAQVQPTLIPAPASIMGGKGAFELDAKCMVHFNNKAAELIAKNIIAEIKLATGLQLKIAPQGMKPRENYIMIDAGKATADESYTIEVNESYVKISGSRKGLFYALQTFKQLLPLNGSAASIPSMVINDNPRFKYRGMHLDVSRHFFPVEDVKRYIDHLAMYKFNTFHWHLTDDQGWRIEIKKYPRLTSTGGWRNGTIIGPYPGTGNDGIRYGGFYTQAQIKEVVRYAAERNITVIPEIEMPGHASAAIAAYPELSCFPKEDSPIPNDCPWNGTRKGKQVQQTWGVFEDVFCPSDYTFNFLQDVLDEVMQLFPSTYIHIGGDECPKESWKRSAFCQQLMKDNNLKDEHELQSYFIRRIEKYLNKKGRRIIGWDEILEGGLAPNATIMSWRGEAGGIAAAKLSHDVIMTPESPLYLNHAQSRNEDSVTQGGFNSLEAVYKYEPLARELSPGQTKYILGAQGNMWSEHLKNWQKLEYMLFPRMAALAEVLWSPKEKRDWPGFEQRIETEFRRYEQKGLNYSKAFYELQASTIPSPDHTGVVWQLQSRSSLPLNYALGTDSFKTYMKPILVDQSDTARAVLLNNGRELSSVFQVFHFNKATGRSIKIKTQPANAYPGNGAFTLVDGIQNVKGMARSSEFLGFSGTDLDVIIDLGKVSTVKNVTIHVLELKGSWIYQPSAIEVSYLMEETELVNAKKEKRTIASFDGAAMDRISIQSDQQCRYLHIVVKNAGIIPIGNPGSGHPAWLFVDEIEVE